MAEARKVVDTITSDDRVPDSGILQRQSSLEKSVQTNENGVNHGSKLAVIGNYMKRFEKHLVEYNLEARGIQRVEESERIPLTPIAYLQVFLLWVSINLAANNITLGMLGPAVYGLSFLDSALCSVLGAAVGSLTAAWSATWGPTSGNRTLVRMVLSFLFFSFSFWPYKFTIALICKMRRSWVDLLWGGGLASSLFF
jgi:hypothetical protein